MNTNSSNSVDVTGFFTNKLKDASVEPPATIWENVKHEIPVYPKQFGNWYVYLSGFLAIVAFTWFGIQKTQQHQNMKAKQLQYKTVEVNNPRKVVINSSSIVSTNSTVAYQKKVSNTLVSQPKKVHESPETSIYQLEATVYPSLTKVEFVDSTNTVRQTAANPVINEFGYYVIDISSLKHGKYTINIYCKDGKKYTKKENLR